MLVPDDALAAIDALAGGNRSAFMIEAALDRVRRLKRELIDSEIEAAMSENAERDLAVYREWEGTMADGLD